eukprot:m.41228 g.41228  ORF g.41228 m.41228 type:complete len:53 (+) comp10407_c1_seq3:2478-2636(+)
MKEGLNANQAVDHTLVAFDLEDNDVADVVISGRDLDKPCAFVSLFKLLFYLN